MRPLTLLLLALPTAVLADAPPAPLTEAAEISFAVAALGLVVALGAVQWLTMRR